MLTNTSFGRWPYRPVFYTPPVTTKPKPIKDVLRVTETELQMVTRHGSLVFVIRLDDITNVAASSTEHQPSLLLRALIGEFAWSTFDDRVSVAFASDDGPQLIVLKVGEEASHDIAVRIRSRALVAGARFDDADSTNVAAISPDTTAVPDSESLASDRPASDDDSSTNAQIEPPMEDSIFLVNGTPVRGQIIDSTVGDSITIRSRGLRYDIPRSSVVRVVRRKRPSR